MMGNTLIRLLFYPTGRRQSLSLALFGAALMLYCSGTSTAADDLPAFTALDPYVTCTGPAHHPVCALKTYVECTRGPLDYGCEAVGLTFDEDTRARLLALNKWPREEPWTLTFAEAHGEGYDYTFFGQRVVTPERFAAADSEFDLPTAPVLEVRVKGCGIEADCSNDAWSYFLEKDSNLNAQDTWRVIGKSHWRNGSAARTCRKLDDPFLEQTYCGHYIHGLPQ